MKHLFLCKIATTSQSCWKAALVKDLPALTVSAVLHHL
jgi:hypothetical protein